MAEQTAISWTDAMKESANRAVHLEVRAGIRPHANTIPCSECSHIWSPGERRHEWHRCRACSSKRAVTRAAKRKTERHARGLRNRWSSRKEKSNG